MLEQNLDVLGLFHALLHHFRCTQEWLTHNHVDLLCQSGEIQRLLASGVAAAHYGYGLLAIEEPVARGAGRDTLSLVLFLVGKAEVFGRSSCCDNHRVGLDYVPVVGRQRVGSFAEVGLYYYAVAQVGTETLCLCAEVKHHLVAVNTFGIARKVLHDSSLCQLSAGQQSAIYHGRKVGA